MTSPQFIAFLERKLKEVGVKKIVPEQKLLAEVYVGMQRGLRLQDAIDDLPDADDGDDIKVPKDLHQRVAKLLKQRPEMRWDTALKKIAAELSGRQR
jgi:hypothetical protein